MDRRCARPKGFRVPRALAAIEANLSHCSPDRFSPVLIGIEQEYRLFDGARQIDSRSLIHDFKLGPPNLDPSDPNAYRLESGAALTCDEAEAEVVLPPVELRPGFTREIAARVARERARLNGLVPELRIEGYSTHLSIATPTKGDRVALMYAQTFAPAMMLLLDRPSSPGLLVRPRPGRTELGGDFVSGNGLAVAATFAAGSVLACRAAIEGRRPGLPPRLEVHLQPDDHRYGWFVDRRAFGDDLYSAGREMLFRRADGGTIRAQEHLEAAWTFSRRMLDDLVGKDELNAVDEVVHADSPLPSNQLDLGGDPSSLDEAGRSAFGDVLRARSRPAFDLAPVMVTWETAVVLIVDRDQTRRAFACIPQRCLARFLDALDAGDLDSCVERYLGRPWLRLRRLHRRAQLKRVSLYDRLGRRNRLLPRERSAAPSAKPGSFHPHGHVWTRMEGRSDQPVDEHIRVPNALGDRHG